MKKIRIALFLQTLFLGILLFTVASISVHAQGSDPSLALKSHSLFVDGIPLVENKGTFGGRVVWFSLPRQGQFIISTTPQDGYKFEQIAEVRGNIISFSLADKFYQLTSSEPILGDGDTMKLWVFHDVEFQPKGSEKGISAGAATHFEYFLKHRKPEKSR